MPGGEQAIREPWRMALAHLTDASIGDAPVKTRLVRNEWQTIERMLQRHLNTPLTSSTGRLFDAVASLAGVRDHVSYEGQAAVELEWLAAQAGPEPGYPFAIEMAAGTDTEDGPLVIDTRPLIHAVADDATRQVSARLIARRFHTTLVDIIAQVCGRLRNATGLNAVVLSGGVFLNRLLTAETCARLQENRFRVYRHELVPPNDGGLSLGQLAIAAVQLAKTQPVP
jgi:hydrogenase maturation protein HypF